MRERISRILQETRLDVFLDSDNEEKAIVENQENNIENDVFLEMMITVTKIIIPKKLTTLTILSKKQGE